ncbi:MAG: glycosyltransferase family 4 protein [bacterium]
MVVPRYGPDVLGGAETQARGFCEEAARRGWEVEAWTTCARSHYTWNNVYPAGREERSGVVVHRFPVIRLNVGHHAKLDMRLTELGSIPIPDQYAWLASGAHSPSLYHHVAKHANSFDVMVALPYAAPLVHYAAWSCPGRVVLWPCLHDEPYAYTEPVRLLLQGAFGVVFLSPEEQSLADRRLDIRLPRSGLLGGGVTVVDFHRAGEPRGLLYAGRLEEGKNLSTLYGYVQRYAEEGGNIRLVVLGRGPLKPPRHPAFEYLGFVSEGRKSFAYASAEALCQPSVNESFSLTVMESWLAGRPVLVHAQCDVTRGHVRRSRGGLWFSDYEEFVAALEWLRANPTLADRMGENGRAYVRRNFSWEAVVSRFRRLIRRWEGDSG